MLITTNLRAFICREPVDMRKSIDGLSYLVEPMLKQNPASGDLFVFVARDRSLGLFRQWLDANAVGLLPKAPLAQRSATPCGTGRRSCAIPNTASCCRTITPWNV